MEELLTQATVAVEWLSLSYVAGSLAWRTHLHFTQPFSSKFQTRFQSKSRSAPTLREVSLPVTPVPPSPKRSPVEQLRQQCQQAGIKWRDAHGKHKHLKKQEMLDALKAINVVPLTR